MKKNRVVRLTGVVLAFLLLGTVFGGLPQTAQAASAPVVETRPATLIVTTTAMLNARIISNGGSSIIERRFSWGTTASCSDGYTSAVSVSGDYFAYNLIGLNPSTTYYYQAWAKNSAGFWGNGSALSFTTSSLSTVSARIDSYSPASRTDVVVGNSVPISVTFTNNKQLDIVIVSLGEL